MTPGHRHRRKNLRLTWLALAAIIVFTLVLAALKYWVVDRYLLAH